MAAGFVALAERQNFLLLLPEQKGLPPYLFDIYVFDWILAWFGVNNQNPASTGSNRTTPPRNGRGAINPADDGLHDRAPRGRSLARLCRRPLAGGAIVPSVPYGCANTVRDALCCMDSGIDRTPAQWARIVRDAAPAQRKFPPLSIWHGGNDIRVVPGNRRELVAQWSALHGIATSPAHAERSRHQIRERYSDGMSTQVESVLVERLGHGFPIHSGGPLR